MISTYSHSRLNSSRSPRFNLDSQDFKFMIIVDLSQKSLDSDCWTKAKTKDASEDYILKDHPHFQVILLSFLSASRSSPIQMSLRSTPPMLLTINVNVQPVVKAG
jgi:hypothetical protein